MVSFLFQQPYIRIDMPLIEEGLNCFVFLSSGGLASRGFLTHSHNRSLGFRLLLLLFCKRRSFRKKIWRAPSLSSFSFKIFPLRNNDRIISITKVLLIWSLFGTWKYLSLFTSLFLSFQNIVLIIFCQFSLRHVCCDLGEGSLALLPIPPSQP